MKETPMNVQEKLVWYASYGSNMLYERFMCYIVGGMFAANGKNYLGCTDKSPPRDNKAFIFPYELYFGNESSSWGGSGVAFLDSGKSGDCLGRMYLVTEEQFCEIQSQEGCGINWYNTVLPLGDSNGWPIKTFTNNVRRPDNKPSQSYLQVILDGMREMLPESNGIDVQHYYNTLRQKIG